MEQYRIINTWDEDQKYEYDIYVENTDEGTVYRMYYSNNETWSEHVRGALIYRVVNDGNSYKFTHNKIPKKELDYAQAAELYVLMSFMNKLEGMFTGDIIHVKKVDTI